VGGIQSPALRSKSLRLGFKDGWDNRIPRNAAEFQAAYRKSDTYKRNLADIEKIGGCPAWGAFKAQPFEVSLCVLARSKERAFSIVNQNDLTSVSDPHARRVKDGWDNRIPRNAAEFQAAYRKSDTYKRNLGLQFRLQNFQYPPGFFCKYHFYDMQLEIQLHSEVSSCIS
jgi:hypothetical protein